MAIEYGKKKKGFLSEDDDRLFREAENAGVAQQTFVDHLVDILKPVLRSKEGCFLDYNYGFTEVVDTDGTHIGGADMLSNNSYAELFG